MLVYIIFFYIVIHIDMWKQIQRNAAEHVKLRDQIRKQFEMEKFGESELLYQSEKLFKPITESTKSAIEATASLITPALQPPQLALPQPQLSLPPIAPPRSKKKPSVIINPDVGLDIEELEQMGFSRPSTVENETYEDVIERVNKYNRDVLGKLKKQAISKDVKEDITNKILLNRDYVKRLRLLMSGQSLVTEGQGLKVVNGKFGSLNIDMKKLAAGQLQAYGDDRELVIDEPADSSLHTLLTKRFDKKQRYTNKALAMFHKLAQMADVPIYARRGKKAELLCQHHHYYSNPNDLVEKLALLVASKSAGNTGVENEISEIVDELLRSEYISKDVAIKLYDKLLQ